MIRGIKVKKQKHLLTCLDPAQKNAGKMQHLATTQLNVLYCTLTLILWSAERDDEYYNTLSMSLVLLCKFLSTTNFLLPFTRNDLRFCDFEIHFLNRCHRHFTLPVLPTTKLGYFWPILTTKNGEKRVRCSLTKYQLHVSILYGLWSWAAVWER